MEALTIGELAQSAGVNVETVRYYERRGLLACPARTGRRRYAADSVRRLALIRRAKRLAFTLDEIQELLDAADDGSAAAVLHAAESKLAQVDADLAELTALRGRLARLVRVCTTGDHACLAFCTESLDAARAEA